MDGFKVKIMGNAGVYPIVNIWILGFINYGLSKDIIPTYSIFLEPLDKEIKTSLHVEVPYQAQFP